MSLTGESLKLTVGYNIKLHQWFRFNTSSFNLTVNFSGSPVKDLIDSSLQKSPIKNDKTILNYYQNKFMLNKLILRYLEVKILKILNSRKFKTWSKKSYNFRQKLN